MIQSWFSSFWQNIRLKTTNPFLGSFIIVWIVRNWQFVFGLFNVGNEKTFALRIEVLEGYLKSGNYIAEFFICIGLTFVFIILIYAFLNLNRLIVNFYDKRLTPLIYRISDFASIVTIADYKKMAQQRDAFESKFEEERNKRLDLQTQIEKLEMDIVKLSDAPDQKHDELQKIIEDLNQSLSQKDKENKRLKNDIEQLQKATSGENLDSAKGMAKKIINSHVLNPKFEKIIRIINRHLSFNEEEFDFFFQSDIIHIKSVSGRRNIELSTFGQEVKKQYLLLASQ